MPKGPISRKAQRKIDRQAVKAAKLKTKQEKAKLKGTKNKVRSKFSRRAKGTLITAGSIIALAGVNALAQQYAPGLRDAVLHHGEQILIQTPKEFVKNIADSVYAHKWNIIGAGAGSFLSAATVSYFGAKAKIKQGTVRIWNTAVVPIGFYFGLGHPIIASAAAILVGFKKPRQILMKWTGKGFKALGKFTKEKILPAAKEGIKSAWKNKGKLIQPLKRIRFRRNTTTPNPPPGG